MKKILFGITFLFALTACDDGDVKIDTIDFDDVPVQKCSLNNLLFKINETDALLFELGSTDIFNVAFTNDVTLPNAPRIVVLSPSLNKVIYRAYDGTVAATRLCGSIVDATPNVIEEWTVISGTAEISTIAIVVTDATTGFEKITGYNHNIVFKDITFQKPNGIQRYDSYSFGSYITNVSLPFTFNPQSLAKSTCTTTDTRLFNIAGGTALELSLDTATYAALIQSSITTTPRTAVLNATNTLDYKIFNATVTNAYFCPTTPPSSPVLNQEWNAAAGVSGVSGIIEVTTTTSGTQFLHTVHLKNVTLVKGNSSFKLGNDYVLGFFFTN